MRTSLYEQQAERQKKFPKNRICFYSSDTSAQRYQSDMADYKRGYITLKMLCVRLAKNNYLEEVTEEQALNELRGLGWV